LPSRLDDYCGNDETNGQCNSCATTLALTQRGVDCDRRHEHDTDNDVL
jgi:hypothetical protein